MPVVPFIPYIISTAGTIYAAKKQNDASKEAQQAQVDASDKAINLQRDIYTQQRADLAPYREGGAGAMNLLNLWTGVTPQSTNSVPGLTAGGPHSSARGPNGEAGQMAQRNPNSPATTFVPQPNYSDQTAVPRGLASLSASPAQQQTQSGYVSMISPSGKPGQVPSSMVQQAIQAGGRLA